jgi:UPF0755 protein
MALPRPKQVEPETPPNAPPNPSPIAPPPRRRWPRAALGALVAVAVLAAVAIGWTIDEIHTPGPLATPATVVVPKGAGTAEIGRRLKTVGVIDSEWAFSAAVWLSGSERGLRAGEYVFEPRASVAAAVDLLESGRTVIRRLTVPEGLTSVEILALVSATDGLAGAVPGNIAEGSLLPETYFFSYGDSRAELVARMQRSLGDFLDQQWHERRGFALKSKQEAVVLASIIEKETGVSSERARVSAVFHNRLRIGMRLQSDPTVIYALTKGNAALGRPLTRDDLGVESPYNTYRMAGLPPGPIGNPGRASILAALYPAVSDELYFVADGNGGHVFARSLNEHNANVAKWRRQQRDGQ